MNHWDPAFDSLTKKERALLGLDKKKGFRSADEEIKKHARRLSKGTNKEKLERDLDRLSRGEWE